MRSRALALLALLLATVALGRRVARALRVPAEPLACRQVVAIEDGADLRVACPDDAALAGCPDVHPGRRYRGCREVGLVSGLVLALHHQPIDVDAASAADLRVLPGIGEALSRRLVQARRQHPFCAPADLHRVRGFGAKRIATLAPHLSFNDPLCAQPSSQ